MTDIGIFIFGMFVFGVAIGSSLIVMIGASDPGLNHPKEKAATESSIAATMPHSQLD